MTNDNKRSFFRLDFERPILCQAKIIGIDESELERKEYRAALVDLSGGGARFYTDAPLPDQANLLVELRFTALAKEYRLLSIVVRTIRAADHHYEYCVQFSLDDADTSALTSLVNNMAIRLRKSGTLSNCSFCSDEDLTYFLPLRSGATR